MAGDFARTMLVRFTRSPLSGAMTGATSTAVLQSSSATTVAAVGFVGAGLLTFSQALGIIFGANIGTTITGWLIVIFGFKLKLGELLLPLILLGTILRLFFHGRWAKLGYTIAGFGLIFVGIGYMQQGMEGVQAFVTPADFPSDTLSGRLQLVAIGIVITLITQSSSSGVAMALTALLAGAINFHQAAALVIGMDVGTTVTAVMASIGGSTATRRTGLSHVIYNLFTAVGALLLLSPYTYALNSWIPDALAKNPEFCLVGFHTLFNTLGVIVVLPFTQQFARFVERVVPGSKSKYTSGLDVALLKEPNVALTAAQKAIHVELLDMLRHARYVLLRDHGSSRIDLAELHEALAETSGFVDQIHLETDKGHIWQQLLSIIHALDHMQRLYGRIAEEKKAQVAAESGMLEDQRKKLLASLDRIIEQVGAGEWQTASEMATTTATEIGAQVEPLRDNLMTSIASGATDLPAAGDELDAIRWIERVSIHIARICSHIAHNGDSVPD